MSRLTRGGLLVSAIALTATASGCSGAAARERGVSAPTGAAEPVELTYLGVAGWELVHAGSVLLLDPYFTRASVQDRSQPLLPDTSAILRFAPTRADVILVGHSHYDHLLDVPTIAQRTSATVVGTPSTLNVARAAGIPEQRLLLAVPDHILALHAFTIRPLASLHSLTGEPSRDIPRDVRLPLAAGDYGEGGTLAYAIDVAGRSLLFLDTANFEERALGGLHPDVAVIAIGLREKIPDYACRLMRLLGNPALVFANHFDSFSQPLTSKQTRLEDGQRAEVTKFSDEIHACSPATKVVLPEAFRPYRV
jgi:L-ascorbate metabolism protein UlaG (beta-lactamase superfamily)